MGYSLDKWSARLLQSWSQIESRIGGLVLSWGGINFISGFRKVYKSSDKLPKDSDQSARHLAVLNCNSKVSLVILSLESEFKQLTTLHFRKDRMNQYILDPLFKWSDL